MTNPSKNPQYIWAELCSLSLSLENATSPAIRIGTDILRVSYNFLLTTIHEVIKIPNIIIFEVSQSGQNAFIKNISVDVRYSEGTRPKSVKKIKLRYILSEYLAIIK